MKSRLLLLLTLSCLAALSIYSALVGPGRVDTIRELVGRGPDVRGRQIELVSDVRVISFDADGMLLEQGGTRIEARIPQELKSRWDEERVKIAPREFISLRGTVLPGPGIEVRDYHLHRGRTLKIWLSLAALLVAAAVIFYEWREERRHA